MCEMCVTNRNESLCLDAFYFIFIIIIIIIIPVVQ
jgi:hypothetical protein